MFGHNWLQLIHEETGARLRFDVSGALMQWVLSSVEHGSGGLKVPAASVGGWAERWPAMFQTQDYDWTYSTNYRGDATVPQKEPTISKHVTKHVSSRRRPAKRSATLAKTAPAPMITSTNGTIVSHWQAASHSK